MRTTPYQTIPSSNKWYFDSYIVRAVRKNDKVLKRIDRLLKDIGSAKDAGETTYLLCELYFATNYWLNNYRATYSMNNRREPAVRMLREFIENRLASTFNCSQRMVRAKLQKYYTKTLTAHGVWCDRDAPVLRLARREKFKLVFEHGKAYWLEWWKKESGKATKLLPVNTARARESTVDAKTGDDIGNPKGLESDWAFFAMSFDRDIYIGPHKESSWGQFMPVFHSSYLNGVSVQFAGSIHVVKGKVLGVRNDSGHYQPNNSFFINILSQLKTVGVDLKKVELFDYENDRIARKDGKPYRADRYLAEHGRWEMVVERKNEYLLGRAALATALGRKVIYERIYPQTNHTRQSDLKTNQNLKKLAREQYQLQVRQGKSHGPGLWKETWVGICNAIVQFMPSDDKAIAKYRTAWRKRASKPDRPPKPSSKPRGGK
jgi:hypothetical protein